MLIFASVLLDNEIDEDTPLHAELVAELRGTEKSPALRLPEEHGAYFRRACRVGQKSVPY